MGAYPYFVCPKLAFGRKYFYNRFMSPGSTRRSEDATAVQARCRSLFLRIEPQNSNLTHMKAHDLNRKDIASLNASALPTMPAGFEQLRPVGVHSFQAALLRPVAAGALAALLALRAFHSTSTAETDTILHGNAL